MEKYIFFFSGFIFGYAVSHMVNKKKIINNCKREDNCNQYRNNNSNKKRYHV